jgi:hypothetical protein
MTDLSALALSGIIFALLLAGILVGALLRRALPKTHLSKDTQDVVRLGAGLIATIGGLLLGLLIASAKGSYDTESTQVQQITADLILLDTLLKNYGPEALPIRNQMRNAVGPFVDRLWHEQNAETRSSFATVAQAEKVYLDIQALTPQNDLQRSLQARAVQVSTSLAQTRLLLFVESGNNIPTPFLAILVFWLFVIFVTFSLFSPLNATGLIFLCLFAFSTACALFLILELNAPFAGLMQISSDQLRNALAPLGP